MTELAAAVGTAQAEKLDAIVEHHRAAAAIATSMLEAVPWLRPQKAAPASAPVYWKWAASVDPMMLKQLRERLRSGAPAVKFGLYPGGPAYLRPALSLRCAARRGACRVAEQLSDNAIVLDISYSKPLEVFEAAVRELANASVDCSRASHAC
jgi:dTDP-4-amino-4,6-dideoxygalactose transaminase